MLEERESEEVQTEERIEYNTKRRGKQSPWKQRNGVLPCGKWRKQPRLWRSRIKLIDNMRGSWRRKTLAWLCVS